MKNERIFPVMWTKLYQEENLLFFISKIAKGYMDFYY